MLKKILLGVLIVAGSVVTINAISFITGFTAAMVVYAYDLMLGWLS